MAARSKITFADVLCSLRERLLDAMDRDDQAGLIQLKTTFTLLKEAAYPNHDRQIIALLVAFEDAARDAAVGFRWKRDVPSLEAIQAAFTESA